MYDEDTSKSDLLKGLSSNDIALLLLLGAKCVVFSSELSNSY